MVRVSEKAEPSAVRFLLEDKGRWRASTGHQSDAVQPKKKVGTKKQGHPSKSDKTLYDKRIQGRRQTPSSINLVPHTENRLLCFTHLIAPEKLSLSQQQVGKGKFQISFNHLCRCKMVFINRISKMSCALFWIFMAAATRGLERAQKGAGSEAFTDLEGALSTTVQGRWKFPTENEGECLSPIQEVGICIMVRRCPGLLTIRDINQLRRFICGFEGKTPLLCCPYSYQNSTPSPDPVATPAKPQFANQKPDKSSPPDQQETVIYPGTLPNDKYPNRLPQQPRPAPVFPQFGIASVRPEQPARPQGQHPPKERQPSQSRPRPKPPSLPLPASSVDPSMGSIRPFPPGRPAKPNFLPQTCGFSNVSLSRIVGGSDAQPGAWPWMAAIYVRYNGLSTHTCGGALVSSKHIITAAHCVGIGTRQQTLPPSIFVVRLGDHNLQTTNDLPLGSTFEVAAAGIRRHSAFDPRTYLNDIALLLLTAEVPFTRYIQPVCLPYEAVPENIAGHYGFITGWGYTKFGRGSGSDVLQQAQVKIWSQKECAAAFQKEVTISEEYICAGDGLGLQDSCQGDSGGPLVFFDDDRFYLIGIVSFGKRCATPGYPGAYTRITKYLDWLNLNF